MKMKREQPAKESYFFRQGYVDLMHTIKGVHALNKNAAMKQITAMKGKSFSIQHYGLNYYQQLL